MNRGRSEMRSTSRVPEFTGRTKARDRFYPCHSGTLSTMANSERIYHQGAPLTKDLMSMISRTSYLHPARHTYILRPPCQQRMVVTTINRYERVSRLSPSTSKSSAYNTSLWAQSVRTCTWSLCSFVSRKQPSKALHLLLVDNRSLLTGLTTNPHTKGCTS